MEAPEILDGAQVIFWAWSGERPFGFVPSKGEGEQVAIYGLAICRYPPSTQWYRFSCDHQWQVVQDSDYDSAEEAMEYLPQQYRLTQITH